MRPLNHLGGWISHKLDQFAKRFITKQDLMDIGISDQENRINDLVLSLKTVKTSKKNLEDLKKGNEKKLELAGKKVNQFVKRKEGEEIIKLQIRHKLDQEKQNEFITRSIETLKNKERTIEKTIKRLRSILDISKDRAEFYKTTFEATKTNLKAVDISPVKRINVREIMDEIQSEINSMENEIEAIDEMEQSGIVKKEDDISSDVEVDEQYEKLVGTSKPKSTGKTSKTK